MFIKDVIQVKNVKKNSYEDFEIDLKIYFQMYVCSLM